MEGISYMFMQVSLPVYYCIILFAIVQDEYGIDWDSPSGVDVEGIVEIPETEGPLTGPQFEELKYQLNHVMIMAFHYLLLPKHL